MKRTSLLVMIIIVALLFASCSNAPAKEENASSIAITSSQSSDATSSQAEKKQIIVHSIESKAIANNMIGESGKKEVYVYLPQSYYNDESKNYPVVYYFHGYSEYPGAIINNIDQLNASMTADGAKEFIVVEASGDNKYGGSFYANSPIIGNYEDYIIDEVIPFIDTTYRTIKTSDGRGAAGFSMGGFSCINLSLKHPDVFSSVYSLSPGIFDENGLKDAMPTWEGFGQFKTGYGQTFCPMPEVPEEMTLQPKFDGTKEDQAIIEKWNSGYGDFSGKLQAYLKQTSKLKAITIQVGEYDSYAWIPNGCKYFSKLLKENKVEHELIIIEGLGHQIPSDFISKSLVPFFNKNLTY